MTERAEFDHVIVTRFTALFTPDHPPADEAWLRYRLGFFVEATCASVRAQRDCVPPLWLVVFDDRAEPWFHELVAELSAGLFEPIWTHEVFGPELVAREIAARSDAPYLISTRLDSDDALGADFAKTVQAQFERQELEFVNLARGLQIDRSGAVYLYDYPSNPFVSLIERRTTDAPRTIFATGRHGFVRELAPLREVITTPMWLQVVHDTNIANEVRGRRVAPSFANDAVVMDLDYRRTVPTATVAREALVQSARVLRLWLARPWLAKQWLTAKADRLRGTRTLPSTSSRAPAR